jgi:hypothetical protein
MAVFNAEFCLVSLKVICDDLLGHPLPLLATRFEHAAPDYRDSYAEHFNQPAALRRQGQRLRLRPALARSTVATGRQHHPSGHGRPLPQTEYRVHRTPGVAGADSPAAQCQLNAAPGLEGWPGR